MALDDPAFPQSACLIPISVDAVVFKSSRSHHDHQILPPLADFSKLPGAGDPREFVSRALITPEFQAARSETRIGVHLHWMLPDAVRRTLHFDKTVARFPAAPNRWLVERMRRGEREQAWIIESDFISKMPAQPDHPTVPLLDDAAHPFRYIGRRLTLTAWQDEAERGDYWRDPVSGASLLSAVGYGDPAFAAFYPNCSTVFGFHDDNEKVLDHLGDISYQVSGWYNDARDDVLIRHRRAYDTMTSEDYAAQAARDLRLLMPDGDEAVTSLCRGSLIFQPDGSHTKRDITMVGLGNTGSEALAACLAHDLIKGLDVSAKTRAEETMQAIILDGDMRDVAIDLGAKFDQARHASGFDATDAGILWSIDALSKQNEVHTDDPQAVMPSEFAPGLAALQRVQTQFNAAQVHIEKLRAELYADWYEYQKALYASADDDGPVITSDPGSEVLQSDPDGDVEDSTPGGLTGAADALDAGQLKAHILRVHTKLERLINEQGELRFDLGATGKFVQSVSGSDASRAAKVAQAAAVVLVQIEANNANAALTELTQDDLKYRPVSYGLNKISAPRYWQAKNPVLVLGGPGARGKIHDVRDENGLSQCRIVPCPDGIAAHVTAGVGHSDIERASNIWRQQPWYPIMMEWAVDVFPAARDFAYGPDFISRSCGLDPDKVELTSDLADGVRTDEGASNERHYFTGTTVVTQHPRTMLRHQFETYLKSAIERDFEKVLRADGQVEFSKVQEQLLASIGVDPSTQNSSLDEQIIGNIEALVSQYVFHTPVDAIEHIKAAYTRLISDDFVILSQSLGGFNHAMLQHSQVLQLPVMDPNIDDSGFAQTTERLVAGHETAAPNSQSAFMPIRAGTIALDRLRVIDRFGQSRMVDMSDENQDPLITPAHIQRGKHKEHHVVLPPRLSQEARLHFRWLDAVSEDPGLEANDASSPVCGWVIPNFLDNTLDVHDANGAALGAITSSDHKGAVGGWRIAPGAAEPVAPDSIENPHLRRLVGEIISTIEKEPSYLNGLVQTCGSALQHINPVGFTQHKSAALLFGRPIAVVRACLSLELKGAPAVDRSVTALTSDIAAENTDAARTTLGFEDVNFPLRLGEFEQLNDGLVGYWQEFMDSGGQVSYSDHMLYAPQSSAPSSNHIEGRHNGKAAHLDLTVRAEPHYVTMLMDPRGEVHATTGILPTKALSIPLPQYADALEAIEVTFEIFPVLSDKDNLHLPLGPETTSSWSWIAKTGDGTWTQTGRDPEADPRIHPASEEAQFGTLQKLQDGWLKLQPISKKHKEPKQ